MRMGSIAVRRQAGGLFLAAMGLTIFSACGEPGQAGAEAEASETSTPWGLECPEGDLQASIVNEFDGPSQSRPESPREALAEFFTTDKDFEGVDASEWTVNEERSNDEYVSMEANRGDRRVGLASIASTEGSWIVETASICESYAQESAT